MLEWYLGLPAAQAGERTDWRFEFPAAWASWLSARRPLRESSGRLFNRLYRRDAARGSRRMRALLTVSGWPSLRWPRCACFR